ncbi:MAG TPA: F0F1 ATP synthase subunit A [Alphaproteobacteria bacterium]
MATESSPLHQFSIERLIPIHIGGVDASFTNSAAFMAAAVVLASGFVLLSTRRAQLVPGRWQSMAELTYEFIARMIDQNVGQEGRRYVPFVFTLFMFILLGNLLGMIPYSFTFTSHIVVTFALAALVFVGVTLIGIFRHGLHFLSLFAPRGVPIILLLLLVPIEVLSYFIRPFTLSIRLFANMMAGHTMLVIFAGFVASLGVFGILPIAMNTFLVLLELLVAVLQAYVFAILTCLYLRDAIHLH